VDRHLEVTAERRVDVANPSDDGPQVAGGRDAGSLGLSCCPPVAPTEADRTR
jgi:hypothetical protein